jgi:hypothetical protein
MAEYYPRGQKSRNTLPHRSWTSRAVTFVYVIITQGLFDFPTKGAILWRKESSSKIHWLRHDSYKHKNQPWTKALRRRRRSPWANEGKYNLFLTSTPDWSRQIWNVKRLNVLLWIVGAYRSVCKVQMRTSYRSFAAKLKESTLCKHSSLFIL